MRRKKCGAPRMAQYFRSVDLQALEFEPVAKHNRLYVAALAPTLRVQTPPVQLATALGDDEPFALLRPTGPFAQFLRDAEARVLATCVQRKGEWFPHEVDDDELRHNFKSFFVGDDGGSFKVKVLPGELAVFDAAGAPAGPEEAGAGCHVRCVLELARVCFGRREFGAMWRLAQARVVDVPPCLIDEGAEEEAEGEAEEEEAAAAAAEEDPEQREFA